MSDRKRCPTCRQFLPHPRLYGVETSPIQKKILRLIRTSGDNGVSLPELVEAVYADDPEGGPITANRCMYVQIFLLNKKLRPKGWEIAQIRTNAAKFNDYYLRKVACASS